MNALSRMPLVALLFFAAGPGWAGVSSGGSQPTKLTSARAILSTNASVRVIGATWTGPNGKPVHRRLARPTPLAGLELTPPAGEWSDVTLVLDGPLVITGETAAGDAFALTLDVAEWTIALDEPVVVAAGERVAVDVDIALPGWLSDAAEGGLVVGPGDRLHDRLVVAVQDGALGHLSPR